MKNINDMSEEEQINLVKKDPRRIRYIENPSLEVQLAAVKQNPFEIQHIKNPSEEVKLAAVQGNGYTITNIKDPSLPIQIAAIKEYVMSIEYIDNPSPKLFIECKNIIIRFILETIKENHTVSIISIIEYLDKHNVKWPELDIIKRYLKHDRII